MLRDDDHRPVQPTDASAANENTTERIREVSLIRSLSDTVDPVTAQAR